MKSKDEIICPICKRHIPPEYQEKHHLKPKSRGGKHKDTLFVCCSCGDTLHQLFTNKELDKEYNTLEKILANEQIRKWIKWIRRKPDDFSVCMKTKKKR